MNDTSFTPWTDVCLDGGFWGQWQNTVAQETSRAIYKRFDETGRIGAMKLSWKAGMPQEPHVFWDSDVAKWMEGTAYLLAKKHDAELAALLDAVIDCIEAGQTEDGYFNSAFLTHDPQARFTDRTDHELYTAGHLIEAAVAHFMATGSTRFLNLMKRFADCIENVFVHECSAKFITPGHQELELALYRLWQATGEKRYLALSKHFVDARGRSKEERVFSVPNGTPPASPPQRNHLYYNDTYAQDEYPAVELTAAGGHAVRAMYYYSAMADLAKTYSDESLRESCKRLWEDSVSKKMYITGGVSAERYGEAIGTAYVLPNDYSYAETCASVAMANFSQRMFTLEPHGKYADMIERQMYNGALVGLSIDGKGFFYDNALLSRPAVNDFMEGIHAKPLLPAYRRQELFECSCCPPNLYRFLAALGQYFYSSSDATVFIHQYAGGTGRIAVQGSEIQLAQETNYPWDGHISIRFTMERPLTMTVALRIPGWCKQAEIRCNDTPVPLTGVQDGYLALSRQWDNGDTITLDLAMPVVQMEGNPHIVDTTGKVALMRGPIVYCVEELDNPFNIFDLTLPRSADHFRFEQMEIAGLPAVVIRGTGLIRRQDCWKNQLYREYQDDLQSIAFTAIPYFAWANRGDNSMTVWIQKQS